jgi:hypothetical protein
LPLFTEESIMRSANHTKMLMSRPDLSMRLEGGRALITMTAVLGTFGCALVLRNLTHESLTIVILGVVLSLSLARQPAQAGWAHQLLRVMVVPLVALGAASIGHVLLDSPNLGATLFIGAMTATMWLRQFGPGVARLAKLLSLPITSILVVPGIGLRTSPHTLWWQVAVALIALAWVVGTQRVAAWLHLLPVDRPDGVRPERAQAASILRSGHTRMALQLAVALTAAFVLGRTLFPMHWNWTVLTATIVCGGGPSRGEVVMKGAARLVGAGVGTVVAAWLGSVFPQHQAGAVVVIFGLLFVATWWREAHYAVWAAAVTCVMALLTTYLGSPSTTALLGTRLEAIVVGAVCAIAASALVVPITTTAIVRRRRGAALQALGGLAHGLAEATPDLIQRLAQFETLTEEARRAVRPLRMQQALVGRVVGPDPRVLSTVGSVVACRAPARATVAAVQDAGTSDPELQRAALAVARNIGKTRQTLAGTARGEVLFESVDDERLAALNDAVLAITWADLPADGKVAALDNGAAEHVAQ